MTSPPSRATLIGFLVLACAGGDRVELPADVYEAHDPAVRAQIEGSERRVRSLEKADAPDADLAAAVGELGKLYHALQLLDTHAFGALQAAEHCYGEARRLDPSDHRWPYLMAFAAQNQGDLDGAASAYRAALEEEPEMLPALHRLAETEVGRGSPDEAAALWNRALEIRPDFAPALYGLGTLELARGEAATAADLLERALVAEPGAGRGHYSLGMAYRNLGDEERAANHLARASHTDFPLEDPLVGELAYIPAGSAALVQQGLIAVQAGEFAAASSLFGRAVDADPTNMEARRQLALAHIDAGQFDQGQAAYEELLALDPAQATGHFGLGQLHASRGRPLEAIRHLTRATQLAPDYKQAHYQLALLLDRSGQAGEALRSYDRVLALDPAYAEAATRRAAALAATGQPAEALAALEQRLQTAPSDAAALQALSFVLRQQNRLREARDALARGLASGRFTGAAEAGLRTELGGVLAIEGRLGESASELRSAQRLDPLQPETSFLLGMVLTDLRRPDEAARAFAAALAVRPDLTQARLRLAFHLARTERCPEALTLVEDGLRLAASDPALTQALGQLRTVCAEV